MTGREVECPPGKGEDDERFLRLCDETGALVSVGAYDAAAGVVRPRVVLEGNS